MLFSKKLYYYTLYIRLFEHYNKISEFINFKLLDVTCIHKMWFGKSVNILIFISVKVQEETMDV